MGNTIKLGEMTFVNLAIHPISLKSEKDIYMLDSNPGVKPELESVYNEVKGEKIKTFKHMASRIKNLPPREDKTIYIVPLFIISGIDELVREGKMSKRSDIRSPGKKVFGKGGKVLYANGLRMG